MRKGRIYIVEEWRTTREVILASNHGKYYEKLPLSYLFIINSFIFVFICIMCTVHCTGLPRTNQFLLFEIIRVYN